MAEDIKFQIGFSTKGAASGLTNIFNKSSQVAFGFNQIAQFARPMVDAIGDAVKDFAKLEKEMAAVESLGVKNIGKLKEEVMALSTAIPESSTSLASGLYQVVSAGVDAEYQINFLETAAQAAAAGISSTAEAVNLGSAVIKGYGKNWSEMSRVMDLSFQTVKLGQTTFPELAANMQMVIPAASSLKIGTEELFGAYATLTGVTGNTAIVSTQLRSIMMSLSNPTDDLVRLVEKQGHATVEAAVKAEGLGGILKIIGGATKGSSTEMNKYFRRVEAVTAALALTTSQSEIYTEKTNAMKQASGTMTEAFKVQANTLDARWKLLENTIARAENQMIDGFSPAMKQGIDASKELVESVDWRGLGEDLTIVYGVAQSIGDAFSFVWKFAKMVWGLLETVYGTLADLGLAAVEELEKVDVIKSVYDGVVDHIEQVTTVFTQGAEAAYDALVDKSEDAKNRMGSAAASGRKAIEDEFAISPLKSLDTDIKGVSERWKYATFEMVEVSKTNFEEIGAGFWTIAEEISNGISTATDLLSGYGDFHKQQRDQQYQEDLKKLQADTKNRRKILQEELKNGKISQAEYKKRLDKIDQYEEQQSAKLQKKNQERSTAEKAAAIGRNIMSTYEMATKSYNALAGIPIVGPALGFAAAAAAVGLGLANLKQIEAQSFATGQIVNEPTLAIVGDAKRAGSSSNTEFVMNSPQVQELLASAVGAGSGPGISKEVLTEAIVDGLSRMDGEFEVRGGDGGELYYALRLYARRNNRTATVSGIKVMEI